MKKLSYKLIEWDWKDVPNIKELQSALKKGFVNLYDTNTDGDFYCWIASKTKLTKAQIHSIEKKEFICNDEEIIID